MFILLGKPSLREFTKPVHLTLDVQSYKTKKKKIDSLKRKSEPRKLLLLIKKIKSVFDNILDIF